eukprot:9850741-Prorocentrum_lima.AAC.1
MSEPMPTADLSRMSIAQELQKHVTRVPTTLVRLANWLEEYAHKPELGMRLGSLMEPRAISPITMGAVVSKDDLLTE